jgi:hypothetical protein
MGWRPSLGLNLPRGEGCSPNLPALTGTLTIYGGEEVRYLPHRVGRLMYWFQVEDNMYEVSFCIMWGVIIALGWLVSGGNFWIGIVPVLFMAIGDSATGFVRNALFKRRTKSWWGNLAMAAVSIPIGAILGMAGIIAGALASVIEHFECPPIDDNITVPLVSFIILLLAALYAPSLLSLESISRMIPPFSSL